MISTFDPLYYYNLLSAIYSVAIPIYHSHIELFVYTQTIIFHISFPVCAQINMGQTSIKHSLLALNLPAFLPLALEMEKRLSQVTVFRVLIQRNPAAVLPLLPMSLMSVQKTLSQQHASESG